MKEDGMSVFEDVRIEGHLIDSGIMSKVMDSVIALGGEFETLSFEVGRTNEDPSVAVLRVQRRQRQPARRDPHRESRSTARSLATRPTPRLVAAPADGVFPDGFYSTTNLETDVRLAGGWVSVANPEMDLGVRVDPQACIAEAIPMADVREGDLYVVGHAGIRVHPQERPAPEPGVRVHVERGLEREAQGAGRRRGRPACCGRRAPSGKDAIAVVGPAVVHTGAAEHLAALVELGYVNVLFGGNAVAVHDIEAAMFGTSLGVSLETGVPAARRAPASPARDQRGARRGLDRAGGGAGPDHQGAHVHAREDRDAVRARRLDPRRRPAARRDHRRDGRPARDARATARTPARA